MGVSYIFGMGSVARPEGTARVASALQALGIDRLLLTVHDASFPLSPGEDVGRGSPYSGAAGRFLGFVRALGFTGVQLGPQGKTSLYNPSPFDGTLFARSSASIALGELAAGERWQGLLSPELLARLTAGLPEEAAERVAHRYAWQAQEEALAAAFAELRARGRGGAALAAEQAAFATEHRDWLPADGRYEALIRRYGTDDWRVWPAQPEPLRPEEEVLAARNGFGQLVAHTQHQALRARVAGLGLKLYGDLQVGTSLRDLWLHRALFLGDYVMGAPPSRTNPEGQPWGYPVLDPAGYQAGGERGRCGSSGPGSTRPSSSSTACASITPTGCVAPGSTGRARPIRCARCRPGPVCTTRRTCRITRRWPPSPSPGPSSSTRVPDTPATPTTGCGR